MRATFLAGVEGGCSHVGVRRLTTNMTVMISTKYIIWTTRYSISYIRRAFYCSTELFCRCMRTAMGDKIGVNYGRLSSRPMPHSHAIDKIRSLGANAIKLFDSDRGTLDALVNSGLRVTVAIPNGELAEYANSRRACDEYAAMLRSYLDRNVLIDMVAVGNEATASWFENRYSALLMPVFLGLRAALAAVVEGGEGGVGCPSVVALRGRRVGEVRDVRSLILLPHCVSSVGCGEIGTLGSVGELLRDIGDLDGQVRVLLRNIGRVVRDLRSLLDRGHRAVFKVILSVMPGLPFGGGADAVLPEGPVILGHGERERCIQTTQKILSRARGPGARA
jgi:hypothetical protein